LGCTSNYNVPRLKNPHDSESTLTNKTIKRPFGIVKIINANPTVLESIKRDLYSAPLLAQMSVSEIRIYLNPKNKHFKNLGGGGAHFHLNSKRFRLQFSGSVPKIVLPAGKICVNSNYWNGLLRHELCHSQVHCFKLPLDEIEKISGFRYKYIFYVEGNSLAYPKDGFLYDYSTKNPGEDTADMVGAISMLSLNLQDPFNTRALNVFYCIDRKDKRYLKNGTGMD
jgi:hypothetical protein